MLAAGEIEDIAQFMSSSYRTDFAFSRITPGDPYMVAIQQPNVDVHFTEVVEITNDSIIGKNGVSKEIDTIICATGKSPKEKNLNHFLIFNSRLRYVFQTRFSNCGT